MAGNEFDKQLGELVGKLRVEKGWSQEQLRAEVDVTRRETITQWENGTREIKAKRLKELCKAFDVSADYLLGLSDDPQRTPSAVDELGLSPAAVKEIKELKQYAESSQAPDGDFCRMLAVLNSFLSSNRFSWFLAYIVKAERAAKQTRDAYKPFEDQKRANKPGLPTGPVSFADRESYGYAKYLCISNFEKMLDAFCKAEDLDV